MAEIRHAELGPSVIPIIRGACVTVATGLGSFAHASQALEAGKALMFLPPPKLPVWY